MPDIWERMRQLTPEGLRSWDEAVIVFFPRVLSGGGGIPPCSVKTKNGMARIMGAWMLTIAAVECLTAKDISILRPVLDTFAKTHCTWDANHNVTEAVYTAIGNKMAKSLTQRVDPDQLLDAFAPIMDAKVAAGATLSRLALIDLCCNEYDETQPVDGARIDGYERKVAKWLRNQLPETREAVKSIWPIA